MLLKAKVKRLLLDRIANEPIDSIPTIRTANIYPTYTSTNIAGKVVTLVIAILVKIYLDTANIGNCLIIYTMKIVCQIIYCTNFRV